MLTWADPVGIDVVWTTSDYEGWGDGLAPLGERKEGENPPSE